MFSFSIWGIKRFEYSPFVYQDGVLTVTRVSPTRFTVAGDFVHRGKPLDVRGNGTFMVRASHQEIEPTSLELRLWVADKHGGRAPKISAAVQPKLDNLIPPARALVLGALNDPRYLDAQRQALACARSILTELDRQVARERDNLGYFAARMTNPAPAYACEATAQATQTLANCEKQLAMAVASKQTARIVLDAALGLYVDTDLLLHEIAQESRPVAQEIAS